MKRYIFLLLFFAEVLACKHKNMTLEELKKAPWSKLDKGIEYITLNKGEPGDSINLAVKGFWGSNITVPADVYNEIQPSLDAILIPLLKNKLPKSKNGYLKINLYEMTSPVFLTGTVYLNDHLDSIELNKTLKIMEGIQGVTEVSYISKEMATKRYLGDGNPGWEKVFESNPLPASIEFKFDEKIITPADYESFKNKIKDQLLYGTDVHLSSNLFKKLEGNYYIVEYSR